MEFKIYPFNTHTNYFSADIMATYKGKWVFCKHKIEQLGNIQVAGSKKANPP